MDEQIRQRFFVTSFFIFLLIGLLFKQSNGRDQKPNILFIFIDDLRPAIGAYGDPVAVTPNMDQLAESGTLFSRAYAQQAVCNPSRASMLTGLYPDLIGVWDLRTHFRKHNPDVFTLPQFFKQQGYHARKVGKIFHDPEYAKDPASWSGPSFYHVTEDSPGHKYVKPENLSGNGWKASATERAHVHDALYVDGKVSDSALQLLEELKDSTFFLAVGFRRPHLPFSAPEKYWELYDPAEIPLPETTSFSANVPKYAQHDWPELRGYTDIAPEGLLPSDLTRELRHGYYASTSYVDALIGNLLQKLKELELEHHTIIVLWSDHGFHLGEKGLWTKTTNYELDTRIPMIISAPDQLHPGSRVGAVVESVDLYPTMVDLAGFDIPGHLSGKSLKPLMDNPSTPWNKPAISQFPWPWTSHVRQGRVPPEVMGYSVRTADFRYIQWNAFESGAILAVELYDLRNDPDESVNLSQDENYHETLRELEDLLKEHYRNGFVEGYPGFAQSKSPEIDR